MLCVHGELCVFLRCGLPLVPADENLEIAVRGMERGGRQVYVLTKDSACGRMFLFCFQSGSFFSEVLHPLAR